MEDYRLDPLWLRLAFVEREHADRQLSLPHLIADAQGIDMAAARRLAEEYRRFLFLVMRAGHAVAPPSQIASVLRLHESRSINYWEALAAMVTERPLVAGASSLTESYRRIFGEVPPADIWSTAGHSPLCAVFRRIARLAGRLVPKHTQADAPSCQDGNEAKR